MRLVRWFVIASVALSGLAVPRAPGAQEIDLAKSRLSDLTHPFNARVALMKALGGGWSRER